MPTLLTGRRPVAIVACLAFLYLGWGGLLLPALIRQVEADFGQTDAGMGLLFLIGAAAYGAGSLGGGAITERVGRRPVLVAGAFLGGVGLVALATVGAWPAFLLVGVPFSFGGGILDGGGNGLFLDLFPESRGRSLNSLHLFFSLGALASPVTAGVLVEAGVPWRSILLATGAAAFVVAILFALVDQPSGRHARSPDAADQGRVALDPVLLALGAAIAFYVASEIGVSNWLVRFLDAPLGVATTALTLFWAGLALGRFVAARIGDRFDHGALAAVSSVTAGLAILGAVVVPSVPVSIALFTLAGFGSGPVFPLIVAVGGERFPARSAAVGGLLTAAAVLGGLAYPPVMGFISVAIGLPAAMIGTGVAALASAAILVVVGRRSRGAELAGAAS
ncbi:MAG: MFS transporter [Chloroflexota bacterium]